MKKMTLLLWEGPLSSHDGLARSLQGHAVRLLPASNLEGCLKWLQGNTSIDVLIISLSDDSELKFRDYQSWKRRPEMLDVPTLALVSKEKLKALTDFIHGCEDFLVEGAAPDEISVRVFRLLKLSSFPRKTEPEAIRLGALEI